MASDKNVRETAEKEGRLPAQEEPIDLKGFTSLNPEQAFGWFKKQAGAICYGEYMGRFEKTWDRALPDDAPREDETDTAAYYHQIRLWRPTIASVSPPNGGKSEDRLAPKGSILNVDESKALESMHNLPEQNKGKHIVYIKYGDKRPNRRDPRKTFWIVEALKVRDMKPGETPF